MPKGKIGVQMNRTPIIIAIAIFVAFASVSSAFAATTAPSKNIKTELISAYRLLRQDDEYGASRVLWSVRKALKASDDSVTLKKVERVMVLIQREDYMAARVRLKSVISK